MKRLLALIFIFILSSNGPVFASSITNAEAGSILNGLGAYFLSYYKSIAEGAAISSDEVTAGLKELIQNKLTDEAQIEQLRKTNDLFTLTGWLNRRIGAYNLGINIFIMPESAIVNCWAGKLASDTNSYKDISGMGQNYRLFILKDLFIHDYIYYKSERKDEIGFVARDKTIFCNRDLLRQKAMERWNILVDYGEKRYNPSKSDRLRRRLLSLAWKGLFLESMKKAGGPDAKKAFLESAEKALLKTAVFHEIGHMRADGNGCLNDDIGSEKAALLTELAFGPMPYESLNTVISFAWRGPLLSYRYAGQDILKMFMREIESGRLKIGRYAVLKGARGNSLLRRQDMLYYLSRDQIRVIAAAALNKMFLNHERSLKEAK